MVVTDIKSSRSSSTGRAVRRSVGLALVAIVAMAAAIPAGAEPARRASPVGHGHRRAARLEVSDRRITIDETVRIAVRGVAPGALVHLTLTIVAGGSTLTGTPSTEGHQFVSQADFRADRRGRVDLRSDAPVSGTYRGVDPMGLFWSAHSTSAVSPPLRTPWTDEVHLSASVHGRMIGATDLIRYYLRPGAKSSPVHARGLVGTLFTPVTHGQHPAMIVFGGSEGGKTFAELQAAYLATKGYTTLALAYFGSPGVPAELSLIPLEYFRTATDWLAEQPSVDRHRIGVRGGSRGGELALLLASRDPRLKAVVAAAPSNVVWCGLPNIGQSAWSENGQAVPFLIPKIDPATPPFDWWVDALDTPQAQVSAIPVERINGPVLLLNGTDDQLWPSPEMTDRIMARLRANWHPYPDRHLELAGNGHIIALPNTPTAELPAGGDPADSARAARRAWKQTLRFLDHNLAGRRPAR